MGRAVVRELAGDACQVEAVIRPGSPGGKALEEVENVSIRPCLLEEIGSLGEKTG